MRSDVPPVGDPAYDALLEANHAPLDAVGGLRPAADVIAALNGAPQASELAAEAAALAVFRGRAGLSAEPGGSRHPWHPLFARFNGKLAAAVAAGAVALGGLAAAAYAGDLPAPVQKLAHDVIGAPPAHRGANRVAHPAHLGRPVTPGPAGHTAYGLCTAYTQVKAHGNATQKALAFRNLAAAAGGAANISAYCAHVAQPGPAPTTAAASHSTGKPASHPTHPAHPSHPSHPAHPTGHPSHPAHPTGKPASHP